MLRKIRQAQTRTYPQEEASFFTWAVSHIKLAHNPYLVGAYPIQSWGASHINPGSFPYDLALFPTMACPEAPADKDSPHFKKLKISKK